MPWDQFFALQEIDSQLDHLREELHLASLLADPTNAHLDAEIARARRNEATTQGQVDRGRRQRAEIVAQLPSLFLAHYERLRKRLKTGPWVVHLSTTTCPACNMTLPSKVASDVQRVGDPVACPSCYRLLIYRQAQPGP